MKTCPMCAEEIKEAARKCKHCGEMLEESEPQSEGNPLTQTLSPTVSLGVLVLLLGLGAFIYSFLMDTTVSTGPLGGYKRVVNIHLLARAKNFQTGGLVGLVFGAILIGYGLKHPVKETSAASSPREDLGSKMDPQTRQIVILAGTTFVVLAMLFIVYQVNNL